MQGLYSSAFTHPLDTNAMRLLKVVSSVAACEVWEAEVVIIVIIIIVMKTKSVIWMNVKPYISMAFICDMQTCFKWFMMIRHVQAT